MPSASTRRFSSGSSNDAWSSLPIFRANSLLKKMPPSETSMEREGRLEGLAVGAGGQADAGLEGGARVAPLLMRRE